MTQPKVASHVVHVRLPSREHEEFRLAAKRLQESRSRLLRRAVRDIIQRPTNLLDHELKVLTDAVYQLKAVGRNLNQLMQAVHVGKVSVADTALLESVCTAVTGLDAGITDLVTASRLRGARK
ncbi:MAG: ribbon-helix-helix domain-containing protein [Sulfuricaulis sp.]